MKKILFLSISENSSKSMNRLRVIKNVRFRLCHALRQGNEDVAWWRDQSPYNFTPQPRSKVDVLSIPFSPPYWW